MKQVTFLALIFAAFSVQAAEIEQANRYTMVQAGASSSVPIELRQAPIVTGARESVGSPDAYKNFGSQVEVNQLGGIIVDCNRCG